MAYHCLVENISDKRKHYLENAARLMGSSEAHLKAAQVVVLDQVYRNFYEEKVRAARSWLGEAAFSANYIKGLTAPLAMSFEIPDLYPGFPAPRLLTEG